MIQTVQVTVMLCHYKCIKRVKVRSQPQNLDLLRGVQFDLSEMSVYVFLFTTRDLVNSDSPASGESKAELTGAQLRHLVAELRHL